MDAADSTASRSSALDRGEPHPSTSSGWSARLALRFERDGVRTVLASRRHEGPLRVQKPLYPEGAAVCQAIVVHPPAGIVAGDTLALAVDVGANACAQLTTPGAAKWYRSCGAVARSETLLHARSGALVEWLPQEALVYDGARATIRIAVELEGDACFFGWDVNCLGRIASGERFGSGVLQQALELRRDGKLAWCERARLEGGSRALHSDAMLGGAPVFGTMIASARGIDDGALAICRAHRCAEGDATVTRLPAAIVGRYRGASAAAARRYFATLWRALRPLLAGRDAVPPRIWST